MAARSLLYLVLALVGFAANSLLCRAALGRNDIDASSFTTIRLASGALVLSLLCRFLPRGSSIQQISLGGAGSWPSGILLFIYAGAFSWAYHRLDTGTGAFVLFGTVQAAMILPAFFRGERHGIIEYIGLLIAIGGLAYLTRPGFAAPDAVGVFLMFIAGVAWGIYSLRGRRASDPLWTTAGNFIRSIPFALGLSLITILHIHILGSGALLAIASGALASGIGYTFWYTALPSLTSIQSALVQLLVPVFAAGGGILFLKEEPSARLIAGGILVLSGVALNYYSASMVRRSQC
ncbi:MAG: DMT family transporter [Planctomycetota bacterium]